jgi:hypothetical protein
LFVVVVGTAGLAVAAPTMTSQSDPHPGIHLERWTDAAIPAKLVLVRIDLTSAEIGVYATKEADKGITTSAYASRVNAQVAINGDAFAALDYTPRGLARGDSTSWTNTADSNVLPLVHLRRVGERTAATMTPVARCSCARATSRRASTVPTPSRCRVSERRDRRSHSRPTGTRCGSSPSTAGRAARSA